MDKEGDVYILCYESNGPNQLSERTGSSVESLLARSIPVTAHGYLRAFANVSKKWGGKSPATLIQQEGHEVHGVAVKMTHEEIERLDPFEGYPKSYNRYDIKMINNLNQ